MDGSRTIKEGMRVLGFLALAASFLIEATHRDRCSFKSIFRKRFVGFLDTLVFFPV